MKKKTEAFDSSTLPHLSALVGDRSSLMAAAKLATALSKNPVALVATAIALLEGPAQSNRSLGAIGLDADALGRAACLAHLSLCADACSSINIEISVESIFYGCL